MDEIPSHHFETIMQTCVLWHLQRNHRSRVSQAVQDFVRPPYVVKNPALSRRVWCSGKKIRESMRKLPLAPLLSPITFPSLSNCNVHHKVERTFWDVMHEPQLPKDPRKRGLERCMNGRSPKICNFAGRLRDGTELIIKAAAVVEPTHTVPQAARVWDFRDFQLSGFDGLIASKWEYT